MIQAMHEHLTQSHHVFKNVFTQDILLPKLQQHILVFGKDNSSQELQTALRKVKIHDRILAVQLGKTTLHIVAYSEHSMRQHAEHQLRQGHTSFPAAAGAICAHIFSKYLYDYSQESTKQHITKVAKDWKQMCADLPLRWELFFTRSLPSALSKTACEKASG